MVENDIIFKGRTRTKRQYCSFYTESEPILTYMVNRLKIQDGDRILEPCAGDGIFINKIERMISNKTYTIDAVDMNPEAVKRLKATYDTENIHIRQTNTLTDVTFDLFASMNGHYSKIIGNPPYGAWIDYENRELLKKTYKGYVGESYSLFIRRCLDLLVVNGRLVFIIPDTFLALHRHKELRREILENTCIEEIVLIPSRFFPGVKFGYSNLCILSLTKSEPYRSHQITIINVPKKIEDLYKVTRGKIDNDNYHDQINQLDVLETKDYSFYLGSERKVRILINNSKMNLGDIAHCVTGICSGNNKKYYKPISGEIKRSKGYILASQDDIEDTFLSQKDLINGLSSKKSLIPILKGGQDAFYKNTEWYILWSRDAVEEYKHSPSARFQNAGYYFREGIGVPMVRSKHLRAFMLEKRLFDQSVVGIFPHDISLMYYLLALLNTDICNYLIGTINHTTNNSANYIKRIPIIIDRDYEKEVTAITKMILHTRQGDELRGKLEEIFRRIYKKIV